MIGEFCALLGACSFSAHNIAVRRGMRTAADSGVFMSTSISNTTFLVVIVVVYSAGLAPPLTAMGFFLFVLAGLLTSFTGRILNYAAIRAIGPSRATAIRASSPMITICLAFLLLSERLSTIQFIGAALVIGGVSLLSTEVVGRTDLEVRREMTPMSKDPETASKRSLVGILFAVTSALTFGTGYFLRKLALREVPSPFWGLAVGTSAAWVALMTYAALKGQLKEVWKNNFSLDAPPWFYILAGILGTSGQLLIFLAIFFTEVSIAAVIASSEPLVTLLMSRFLLGKEEPVNRSLVFCIFSVFLGIILVTM